MSRLTRETKDSLPDKCFAFIDTAQSKSGRSSSKHRKLPIFDSQGFLMISQLLAAIRYLPRAILPDERIREEIRLKLNNLLEKYHKSDITPTNRGWKPVESGIAVKGGYPTVFTGHKLRNNPEPKKKLANYAHLQKVYKIHEAFMKDYKEKFGEKKFSETDIFDAVLFGYDSQK